MLRFPGTKVNGRSEPLIQEADPPSQSLAVARIADKMVTIKNKIKTIKSNVVSEDGTKLILIKIFSWTGK